VNNIIVTIKNIEFTIDKDYWDKIKEYHLLVHKSRNKYYLVIYNDITKSVNSIVKFILNTTERSIYIDGNTQNITKQNITTVSIQKASGIKRVKKTDKPRFLARTRQYQRDNKEIINARNRQFITDGKTGGYPTLQSLFWKYIQQYQNIGVQNNQYTYQKLIDYVNGMGTNWMKLVEQMIPATTIWQGGTRFENSVLHRQKFVYRRQRGCIIQTKFVDPCRKTASLVNYGASEEKVTLSIYPWLNSSSLITSFSGILNKQVEELLEENGTSITLCNGINTLRTEWYVDLKIGQTQLVQYKFYDGIGLNGYPTDGQWKLALKNSLPDLLNYNLWFNLNGNNLTITNLTNQPLYLAESLTLDVGININVNC
jgi:hypothetical protein